jgi:predicted CXXCH cytochrome family protein
MRRIIRALALLCVAMSSIGLLFGKQTAPPAEVTAIAKLDQPCAKCHREIYQRYLTTPMANASGLATDGVTPGSYSDVASGVKYQIFERNGAVWLRYDRTGDKNLHGEQKLDYFMGSGSHARTYLYSINGFWFETPIAYYREKAGYDMRPSLQGEKEMPFNLPQNFECMRCHMNGAQVEDTGTRNHFAGPPFLHGGIACEDCHGDTSAHVAARGQGVITNLSKLDPDRQVAICLLCHLEGDASVLHRGRSLKNYKPGDKLADYVSYFVRTGAGAANRGVSQVEGLYLSKCKRMSGPKMSCLTCHDPHYSPTSQERTNFYRAKCLGCHNNPKYANAHFAEQPDCTTCHMPKREAPDLAHSIWSDHRILARPVDDTPQKTSNEPAELIPVPGVESEATPRELALGYYKLAVGGDSSAMERAWTLLQDAVKSDPSDSEVLGALGFLAYLRGDQQRASAFYESALSFDPNDFNVAIDFGVLLARSGKPQRAADLWSGVFENNQDITELGMNVATVQCALGEQKLAEDALRQVLIYSPDHSAARQRLSEIQSGKRVCAAGPQQ